MISPRTRKVFLGPVEETDIETLLFWRNSESYRNHCSFRDGVVTRPEYLAELESDRRRDRHEQYLVFDRHSNKPVGTVYSYGYSSLDGHVFMTAYIDDRFRGFGYGAHAVALFSTYLFQEYGLFKIYTDVYSDNALSVRPLLRFGFKKEGHFVGHRIKNGKRLDMIRLAAHKEILEKAREFSLRLGAANL